MNPARIPIPTKGFDKAKLSYSSINGSDVGLSCTHPIVNLTITISSTNVASRPNLDSLSNLISFPLELRVLHLEMRNITGPKDLYSYLETYTCQLTTLSLNIPTRELIPLQLTIHSLKTLFLAFPHSSLRLWFESFEWKFPLLQNISFDMAGYPDHTYLQGVHKLPMLYDLILQDHLPQIISLRVNPPFQELLTPDSSFHWTKFPKLKAFATNFSQQSFLSIDEPWKRSGSPARTKSDSICHLIQISWEGFQVEDVIKGLKNCMELCGPLENITIPWGLVRRCEGGSNNNEVKSMRTLCQKRGVKVLNMDGEEMWFTSEKDRGLWPKHKATWPF
jgi:hypothetical protein